MTGRPEALPSCPPVFLSHIQMDFCHLAIATVAGLDVVVSWNFGHIVNLRRIRKVNGVNLLAGYGQIDVRSPEEVLREPE